MYVEKNRVVTLYYTLSLDSGEIIDSTPLQKPLHILVGYHHILPGLENAIIGMKSGDKKSGTIEPKDAYGLVDEKLFKEYPRDLFPVNITLQNGQRLNKLMKNGQQIKVVVKSFNATRVVLDSNHPLAGQELKFKTKIVNIRKATLEELKSGIQN